MKRCFLQRKELNVLVMLMIVTSSGLKIYSAVLLTTITNELLAKHWRQFLFYLLLQGVIYTLACSISGLNSWFQEYVIQKMINDLRIHLTEKLTQTSYQQNQAKGAGSFVSWMTNDMQMIADQGFPAVYQMIEHCTMLLFSIIVLVKMHYSLMIVFALLSLFTLYLPRLANSPLMQRFQELTVENEHFTGKMSNLFQGYATLYVLNALSYLPKKVQQFSLQLAKRNVRAAKVHAFSTFLSSFANVFSQIVITGYSGWLIFRSIISFGAFLTIENLSANVMNAMGNLANCLIMISSVQPIFEKYEPLQRKEKQQIINQKLPDHTLQLENVDFSYEDNVIFNRLSLTFEAGKKYIITGASGSGKSTLFHLLTGKISPTSGKLTIGGVDYAQLSANQIHEEVSYVDQVPYVFEASIEENLTLLQDFSHQQLQQVLTSTQFAQVTTQLPQQLETQLGPSELELSGGQKQRLALARTLLRDTPILLLDETTANLDKDTAEQIERYLLSLPNHTVIMITHHLNPKLAGLYDEVIDLNTL